MVVPGGAHAKKIRGTYSSVMGTLKVKERGGVVTGRVAGKNPCGFKKGKVVFEGTRLDDSLTGTVTTCKVGGGCKGKVSGMMMLLITRGGKTLTGAVHLDSGSCKTPIGDEGFTVKRQSKTSKGSGKGKNGKGKDGKGKDGKGKDGKGKNSKGKDGSNEKPSDDKGTPSDDNGSKTGDSSGEGSSEVHANTASTEGSASSSGDNKADAMALLRKGAQLMGQSKVEEARDAFIAATEKDPTLAKAFQGVGVTYYIRGRYDEALDAYKQALEANPSDGDTYYNMACVYALKNDKEQAMNYLQIAALNGFVDWHVFDKEDDLKSLHGDERFEKLRKGDLSF